MDPIAAPVAQEVIAKTPVSNTPHNAQKTFTTSEVSQVAPAPDRTERFADASFRAFDNTLTEIEQNFNQTRTFSEKSQNILNSTAYPDGLEGATQRVADATDLGGDLVATIAIGATKASEFQMRTLITKKFGETLNMFLKGS